MKSDNINFSKKMSKNFNKKKGVITYSGTLAIESALLCLNLGVGSKVLVSSNVCYSIINTILKLHLIPVIVEPNNDLFLTEFDIDQALLMHDVSCVLLVHQYGLLNNINLLKYKQKKIGIIEDIAQAWKIECNNYKVGKYSDFVVTSFGTTKPLSYGIGGGIFFNESEFLDRFDFCDNFSRENDFELIPYVYSKCNGINYKELVNRADNIVKEQRKSASKYYEILENIDFINCISTKDNTGFTWHRYPIWIDDNLKYKQFLDAIQKSGLNYQLPHEIRLTDLNKYSKCIIIHKKTIYKNLILLRTRDLDIDFQLKELKKCIKQCNK